KVDERDRERTMLGFAAAAEEVTRDGNRNALLEVHVCDVADGGGAVDLEPRGAGQQEAVASPRSHMRTVEEGGGRAADHDLAGLGRRLSRDRRVRRGAGDDELPMELADEEEVEEAAVDAD